MERKNVIKIEYTNNGVTKTINVTNSIIQKLNKSGWCIELVKRTEQTITHKYATSFSAREYYTVTTIKTALAY